MPNVNNAVEVANIAFYLLINYFIARDEPKKLPLGILLMPAPIIIITNQAEIKITILFFFKN